MAFIILSDREGEIDRRELASAVTIGRSPTCDVPVRDMLLSRAHCRIEPHGKRWVLIDVGSLNGTRISEELIGRHILDSGEIIRIGGTYIRFLDSAFIPAPVVDREKPKNRPLDPYDAMSSTLAGMELDSLTNQSDMTGFPTPKPRPVEPRAFEAEGVGSLVATMASGVWDTRMLEELPARRSKRKLPQMPVGMWVESGIQDETNSHVPMRNAIHRANHAAARQPVMIELPASAKISAPAVTPPMGVTFADPVKRPGRWLVMTYLGLACAVFATSMYTLAWQFL